MKLFNIIHIILTVTLIQIVYSAPVNDESDLEYGPGYNTYGHQQMRIAKARGIKPIVDTIRENEKYGNDGGEIRSTSKAFIRITEGVSSSLSNILGKPNDNTYNILKPFDPFLTDIGNRLGGLA